MKKFKAITEEEATNLTLAEYIDRLKSFPIPEDLEVTFEFKHENMDLRYPIFVRIYKTSRNIRNEMFIYTYINNIEVEYELSFYQLEWKNWDVSAGCGNLEKGKQDE